MNYLTAKNKYGTYCIPKSTKHRVSCRTVLQGQVWEPETVEFIRTNTTNDIIHAGTYFGDMLPAFCERADHVWAFEPNKENYQCALNTIQWNKLSNVNINNAGLSNKCGQASFETMHDNGKLLGGAGRIVPSKYKGNKVITINTVVLDDIIPKDSIISIIHLDVEGHEIAALEGATRILKKDAPTLILETKGDANSSLKTFLDQIGYAVTGTLDKKTNTICEKV